MTIKTKSVDKFKVEECLELKCPFFHAGIMGQTTCTAVTPNRDITLPQWEPDKSGTYRRPKNPPPDWCPLRVKPITVKLK